MLRVNFLCMYGISNLQWDALCEAAVCLTRTQTSLSSRLVEVNDSECSAVPAITNFLDTPFPTFMQIPFHFTRTLEPVNHFHFTVKLKVTTTI